MYHAGLFLALATLVVAGRFSFRNEEGNAQQAPAQAQQNNNISQQGSADDQKGVSFYFESDNFGDQWSYSVTRVAGNNEQSLLSLDACKDEIHRLCAKEGVNLKDDMAIIECLQDAGFSETETLTKQCEDVVWQFKVKLTQDDRFTNAAKQYCQAEMEANKEMAKCADQTQPGYALSCLIDHISTLNNTSNCHAFLSRTERLAFSDFRLVGPFVDKCRSAIDKFGCSVLTPHKAHDGVRVAHTQGMALECIIDKIVKASKTEQDALAQLGDECKHEVMRLAEMQSDDFHLDRPLYFACRSDREKFCKDIPSGQGKVFECLILKRNDPFMDSDCSKILSERAYMMGRDYRMAHPLIKACDADMKKYKCEPQSQLEAAAHFHMSWILLCLENGAHNQKDQPPSMQCQHEMLSHRQMMMQEFKMAPELVMNCANDIDKYCSPRGDIEKEGKTLHCLMGQAQERSADKQLGAQCLQALKTVVKVADIGSNYKVDKVLYASCKPLIDGLCSQDAVSEAATLTCLMKNIDSPDMKEECEARLLEVQYFMARDWTLDPQLYNACHQDAVSRCSALDNWHMANNVENRVDPGPQVLACLYRSAYDEANPLSTQCGSEVRRVLHTRAVRVNLIPEIEDACRTALSTYCSHNVKPMEEMQCLQDNFEKEEFIQNNRYCYDEIKKFTEMEAKDTRLNRALTKACKPVILTHCQQFKDADIDHGDVMECLLANKDTNEMTGKCRSYVNHFELVSLRDYHFSYRFQQACQTDIENHCKGHGNDKGEIIRCLSEVRFEHKVLGSGTDLNERCKKQLRVAYLQQEQVEFDDKEHMADADPTLAKKCEKEIRQFKCFEANSFEDTVECLREQFDHLGPECQAMVFYREKIEAVDNTLDDELQRKCKYDIGKFCAQNGEKVLDCLTNTKVVRLLTRECRRVVQERMQEAARDVRLRPGLLQSCQNEALRYCPEDMEKIKSPQYAQHVMEGVVVNCLRSQFRAAAHNGGILLGAPCREEITRSILEAELDPSLDPPLFKACKSSLQLHCSQSIIDKGGQFDNILECLKADFYKGAISNQECNAEMARRTEETLVDIHLDPALFEACSGDVRRLCNDVQAGNSRIILCLMDAADSTNAKLSSGCRNKLTDRNQLWMKAHKEFKMTMPENWHEAVEFVVNHPHKGGQFDNILECLKADFYKGAISNQECNAEMARRTEETLVDIHLDPALFEACSGDVRRLCNDVQAGNSRIILCLMDAADSTNAKLSSGCRNKLTDRNQLWMKAHKEFKMTMPENWHEAVEFVVNHPHKVSLLGWLSAIVFVLFLFGCCCGRMTKRVHRELKNR